VAGDIGTNPGGASRFDRLALHFAQGLHCAQFGTDKALQVTNLCDNESAECLGKWHSSAFPAMNLIGNAA
jgi:hypothetical protein